jgi:WD40 repeat protein
LCGGAYAAQEQHHGSAVRACTSGSEDNCIYIYERESGQVVTQLEGHSSVVHLVDAVDSEPLKLVSSSIENVRVFLFLFLLLIFRADHPCAVYAVRALSVVPAT